MQIKTQAHSADTWSTFDKTKLKRVATGIEMVSVAELFENLLCGRISAKEIEQKVLGFSVFLSAKDSGAIPEWLKYSSNRLISYSKDSVTENKALCDDIFFAVAARLFKIRVVSYYERNDGLANQYFGNPKHPKVRVFNTGSAYQIITKVKDNPMGIRAKRASIHQLKTQDASPRLPKRNSLSKRSICTMAPLDFSINVNQNEDCEEQDVKVYRSSNFFSSSSLSTELFENTPKSTCQYGSNTEISCVASNLIDNSANETNKAINQILFCSPPSSQTKPTAEINATVYIPPTFKDKILFESDDYSLGRLKFYNEQKGFGFIVSSDNKDVFVHKDDLSRANINTCQLEYMRGFYEIILKFRYIEYKGKVRNNNKAIDIHVVEVNSIV